MMHVLIVRAVSYAETNFRDRKTKFALSRNIHTLLPVFVRVYGTSAFILSDTGSSIKCYSGPHVMILYAHTHATGACLAFFSRARALDSFAHVTGDYDCCVFTSFPLFESFQYNDLFRFRLRDWIWKGMRRQLRDYFPCKEQSVVYIKPTFNSSNSNE